MFCSIIGHPLKNPRSIKIWKKFFKKKKFRIKMLALDIKKADFKEQIKNLLKNKNFLASAITMPYKKNIIKYVKINDKISNFANSINLIVKKKNVLYGYNTDVYGALESVKNLNNKKIIIYGFGGTGEAIYKTFSNIYKKAEFIVISSKTKLKLINKTKLKKKIEEIDISSVDLFINCSPLGSDLKKKFLTKSPLNIAQLKKMKKNSTVFDIVYSPKKTMLSQNCKKLKIKYINGIKMNTIQAERALSILEKEIKKY
jgi:shikimate dehydrogenase